MLPDTDPTGALVIAERIRAAVEDIAIPGIASTVTVSIGLASYPVHATTPERLERFADAALYVAKRAGRNRVEVAAAVVEPATEEAPPSTSGEHAEPSRPLPEASTAGLSRGIEPAS